MASVPQEDYIRQLLDESFRTESDSENIANDTPDEDEEDHIEVVQEDTVTEQEGEDDEEDADNEQPQQQAQPLPCVPCYTGKDKTTKWKIHCTRPRNVRAEYSNSSARCKALC